jgi:biotin synthase-like enzyme
MCWVKTKTLTNQRMEVEEVELVLVGDSLLRSWREGKLKFRRQRSVTTYISKLLNLRSMFSILFQYCNRYCIYCQYSLIIYCVVREYEIAKKRLVKAKESKEVALVADEEAKEWKERLCGQYQQLVKDADRVKSQKLIYIVDTYGM